MQKVLWGIALLIACIGGYIAYHMLYPPVCSKRALELHVRQELGAMTMVQKQNPATIRALKINYIRRNKCYKKRNVANNQP